MTVGLSSGVYLEEESPQVRALQGGATSILAALGITQRGPFDATLVTSFAEFQEKFGGHTPNGVLSLALQGFFEGGGSAAYVKRVVHYTDQNDAASKTSAAAELVLSSAPGAPQAGGVTSSFQGAYALNDGDTLVVSINGAAPVTATFNGAPATAQSAAGPFTLADDQTLELTVNGQAQTISFDDTEFTDVTQATPLELAAVLTSKLTGARAVVDGQGVRVESLRKGAGARLQVTGGTAAAALGFAAGEQSGTGNVQRLDAVTIGEAINVLSPVLAGATVTNDGGRLKLASTTTGPTSSIRVDAAGVARTAFGFDTTAHAGNSGVANPVIRVAGKTDGSYANDLSLVVSAATSGQGTEFNLAVVDGNGVTRERWPNLSVVDGAPNHYATVLNHPVTGSQRIRLTAEGASGVRPATGVFGPLTGGEDGLVGISDQDFLGSATAKTGLYGFDLTDDARLLIVPDRQTPAAQVAAVQYAASKKRLFAILSAPPGQNIQQARAYQRSTAGLLGLSEFGATYYPHVKVLNPNKLVFGPDETLVIPPDGHIAGTFARQDGSRAGGIYEAAAGVERGQLLRVVGLESTYTQEEANRDLLYPDRINPIRLVGGVPVIDGVRTLKADGNWPTVAERRAVIYIEQAILRGVEFARFRNNDTELRAELRRTIDAFLTAQMYLGAFRSKVKGTAFFVDFSDALNPPSVVFQGCVIGRVGLATQKPGEFIVIRFSQDTRALTTELSAAG